MNILVDTSGWYALIVSKDLFHEQAKKFFQTSPIVTTSTLIFEEVLALVHARQGKTIALKASATIKEYCEDRFLYISPKDNEEILDLYQKTGNSIDYVDASVVWLSRKLDIPVFTFDAHFKKMKVKTLP